MTTRTNSTRLNANVIMWRIAFIPLKAFGVPLHDFVTQNSFGWEDNLKMITCEKNCMMRK